VLSCGLGGGAPQLGEQLAPSAEQRPQQAGDGQDDVAVADRGSGPWVRTKRLGQSRSSSSRWPWTSW
jgi:hypothetical protein